MDTASSGDGVMAVEDMNSLSLSGVLVAFAAVTEADTLDEPEADVIRGIWCVWEINEVLSVPTGYFIYDFFDMVLNQKLSQSWELLFHHIVVRVFINWMFFVFF